MAKAHTKFMVGMYPHGEFYENNWVIKQLLHVLSARHKLDSKDFIRLIVVPEEDQNTLFLQGEEVEILEQLLEDHMGSYRDRVQEIMWGILEKIRETSTTIEG